MDEAMQTFRDIRSRKLLRGAPRRLWRAVFPNHVWSLKCKYDEPLGPIPYPNNQFHHTLLPRCHGSGLWIPAGLPAEMFPQLSQDLPTRPNVEMDQLNLGDQFPIHQPVLVGPSHNMAPPSGLRPCMRRAQPRHVSFSDPISEYHDIGPRKDRRSKPRLPIRDPAVRKMRYLPMPPCCSVCRTFRPFRGWHTCPLHSNLAKWTIVPRVPEDLDEYHICRCLMGFAAPGHIFCNYCEQGGAVGIHAIPMLQEVGLLPGIKADPILYFGSGFSTELNFVAWHRDMIAQVWRRNMV